MHEIIEATKETSGKEASAAAKHVADQCFKADSTNATNQ
tara:strand:- start:2 stop:118 length:117 start_codon:yes stop_codon:yes gene_type:complete